MARSNERWHSLPLERLLLRWSTPPRAKTWRCQKLSIIRQVRSPIGKLDSMTSPGVKPRANMSGRFRRPTRKFDEIITRTKEFSKKSCRADDGAGGADGDGGRPRWGASRHIQLRQLGLIMWVLVWFYTLTYSFINSRLFAQPCLMFGVRLGLFQYHHATHLTHQIWWV